MSKTNSASIWFSKQVLAWYQRSGRKDLPWQQNPSLYRVWVSEIMLQQTQVKTVIPYYLKFMQQFPDISKLAVAEIDLVLHYWSGLGYYSRARNLHKTAQIIQDQYQGQFPTQFEQVFALPGIGRSTAGAILALALEQIHPILDGNVKRVLARYQMIEGWSEKVFWQWAEYYLPQQSIRAYTQAMMDLGANICTRTQPQCKQCPLQLRCQAYQNQCQLEFPQKKPKKSRPIQKKRLLILQYNNQILLQQRPPTGIWGGLWSFPECDWEQEITQFCLPFISGTIASIRYGEVIQHDFSHFRLQLLPCYIQLKSKDLQVSESKPLLWYNLAQPPAIGLAKPTTDLIQQLQLTTNLRKNQ